MKKAMATVVVAGTMLAGLAAASPALAVAGDTQVCSSANGGTMVNGVCVLPALNVGQNAEEFLMNTGGGVDTWTIVAGSIPPGMQMPATYAAGATIIGGTPTPAGHVHLHRGQRPLQPAGRAALAGDLQHHRGPAAAVAGGPAR